MQFKFNQFTLQLIRIKVMDSLSSVIFFYNNKTTNTNKI